ncbi:MAG: DUF4350 domain-containing protein [Candidatus Electrothrix aestuarii]|uniref:DUF4350 domain-containing protein n=1 Tax=Candidatus Electrothrix aestuarii TaxID=3062594 RepID=A0AAU8LXW0_9BACT|nr:DUF4350 domain-containing protein [Candidatus Electrothrix aestuarii]
MVNPGAHRGRSWIALLLLTLSFCAALLWIFSLRLESGDFLPAYSSLRKDPMGTAVLYESLQKSGLKVERNHEPFSNTLSGHNTTLLVIGHKEGPVNLFRDKITQETITSFVEQGGRLVITTGSVFSSEPKKKPESSLSEEDKEQEKQDGDQQQEEQVTEKTTPEGTEVGKEETTAEDKKNKEDDAPPPPAWAVHTGFPEKNEEQDEKVDPPPATATGKLAGKQLRVTWPDRLVFKDLFKNQDDQWQVLLTLEEEPVLIERQLGRGSIVLATSSFFLSNEAMLRDRQVSLIKWLLGSPSQLIVDEFHHGLRSRKSVVSLVRSHNLHGIILGLFLLAVLFLWKNSSSLLPRSSGQQVRPHTGRNQFEGMVNTLRLHHPDNLVGLALQQWERGNRKWCENHPEQLEKMRQIAEPHPGPRTKAQNKAINREEKQIEQYRAITRILHENNKRTHQQRTL